MEKRYFLLMPDSLQIGLVGLTAVEPQTWELQLLRDLNHDEAGTSIYRLTAALGDDSGDVPAPETAGRGRAVLRVPKGDNKMLAALERVEDFNGKILLEDENVLLEPDQVVVFRPPAEENMKRHVRTAGPDA